MRLFSERMGFKKPREALQLDGMDSDLRTAIWNWMYLLVFKAIQESGSYWGGNKANRSAVQLIWIRVFKYPLDTIPTAGFDLTKQVRLVVEKSEFHVVYSLVEVLLIEDVFFSGYERDVAIEALNSSLESEGSGYRYIGTELAPITSSTELSSIEAALNSSGRFDPASRHIERALQMFSDRKNPDHRNSIKESISAVEAACRVILGEPKATLGEALKSMDALGIKFHPALRDGLNRLYGYTSDEGGIRHSLYDEAKPAAAEARFMLVACSAFVNFLVDQDSARRATRK